VKRTAFVSHYDCSRHDTGWDHPEHQGRLPALMRKVHADMLTLFEPLLEVEGRHASEEELRLVHEAQYVERVRGWSDSAEERGSPREVSPRLVASAATWAASLAAVGCVLTAIDVVLRGEVRNAFCAIRPPGRDATAGEAGRFGFFNQMAIAARHLLAARGLASLLLVEWGGPLSAATRTLLGGEPGVRIVSVGESAWSGAAADPTVRVLPAGSDGAAFLAALNDALGATLDDFSPDLVLLSAGFDALAGDPLGGLGVEPADFHALTTVVREAADVACGGRLVSVLEGGYAPRAVGAAAVQHLRALIGIEPAS
jgi:acetoin utilization deacetylase AcuC-like enzyme